MENKSHIKTKEKEELFHQISNNLVEQQNLKLLPLLIEEYFFNTKEINGFGIKNINRELSYKYLNSTFHSGLDIIHKLCNNLLINRLTSEDKVIDCGCGTGIISNLIVNHIYEVIAIDIDPSAIESAKKNIQNHEKLRFLVHDFTNDVQIAQSKATGIICNPPFFIANNDYLIPDEALGWIINKKSIAKMFSFFRKNLIQDGRLFLIFSEWSSYNLFLNTAKNLGFCLVDKQSITEWNDYFQQDEKIYLFETRLG